MLAGLPDWRGLLQQMAESVRSADALTANQMSQCVSKGRFTKAADYFWLCEDVRDGDKLATVRELLGTYDCKALEPLASLPFKSVVTTNFDRAILDALAATTQKAPMDFRFGDATFSQAIWETALNVTRIHGCIEAPQSMVLSDHQFAKLLENSTYIDLLTHIFTHKCVLFLGFSFYDPAIKYVLELIDKRFGSAAPGRHLAILPDSNASDLIQKASRLNIKVVQYQSANKHEALWAGIATYAESLVRVPVRLLAAANHPYAATKQYLAACYARASVASNDTPLRAIVVEGILSACLQGSHPKSLGLLELREQLRRALGVKGADVNDLIDGALKELGSSKLIRKHQVEGQKGSRFAWIGEPETTSPLNDAIETLKKCICDRAHVQEGWKPPPHVADAIGAFLKEVIHKRGWDLGAAFAAGKAPDIVSFRPALADCGIRVSAFDMERVARTVESLFQRPTPQEAVLLGELGRISFAVELAFQTPRTTLLHKSTLPHRLYFDANLLLPAFVEGHPHFQTYQHTLRRLQDASSNAGTKLQLLAYSGYLNEMINHKNAALKYASEAGDDFEALARSDVIFHGAANVNVYVGAYVNAIENGFQLSFVDFLERRAPYATEIDLRRWIQQKGFVVVESFKTGAYPDLYATLEKANAAKLLNGKQPILIEHDALQLALLDADCNKGEKALFVTADQRLYEDIVGTTAVR